MANGKFLLAKLAFSNFVYRESFIFRLVGLDMFNTSFERSIENWLVDFGCSSCMFFS